MWVGVGLIPICLFDDILKPGPLFKWVVIAQGKSPFTHRKKNDDRLILEYNVYR